MNPDPAFWRGKSVLLTGHTGFKGAWTAVWLARLGARVIGLALPPEEQPALWEEVQDGVLDAEIFGDIRDPESVGEAVERARPEVVLHMAAQALVRRSYADPVGTFATNVMGTVHILEALRGAKGLQAVLVVTTDKVYANNDQGRDFVEDDALGGDDPYSASKAACEIAIGSYAASFFKHVPLATARAGNVIGGGDWSKDRLVPDVVRAAEAREPVALRNPRSTRPWQHVMEPVSGYLLFLQALARGAEVPRSLNFGPPPGASADVAFIAEAMAAALGSPKAWVQDSVQGPPEMNLLSIDPARANQSLGWHQRLTCQQAVEWTAEWYRRYRAGESPRALCEEQIELYEASA